jgi:hypothetical protein
VIGVVVLQNGMNLRKGERGSGSDTCVVSTVDGNQVTGIEAESVSSVTEEDQVSMTIAEIKTEPNVSVVPFKGFITCLYIVLLCCMLFMKHIYFQVSQHLLVRSVS